MNIARFIAVRYFFTERKRGFVQLISSISMVVVGIGTMSLIIVLSVFNGLEGLLKSLYARFDAPVIIRPLEGKSFEMTEQTVDLLDEIAGKGRWVEVIEDNVLIRYQNAQRVVRMKGVSDAYLELSGLPESIVYGQASLTQNQINYALVGRGIQYELAINPSNDFYTLQFYFPKNLRPGSIDPTSLYTVGHAIPTGVFAIEKYYDENYVFIPLRLAKQLTGKDSKLTAIEVYPSNPSGLIPIRQALEEALGSTFSVRLGIDTHEDLYKLLKIEKLAVFIVFSLIIAIASINIFFTLTLMVIDKQRDIKILASMGTSPSTIGKIFRWEGALISLIGAFMGILLGLVICFLQQYFGFISMGMATSVMDAYPVEVVWSDVLYVCLCIITITWIASLHPSWVATRLAKNTHRLSSKL